MLDAIIHINKSSSLSSAAAVGRVKRLVPRGTRVGHAGTLDPFATGVLVILIGRATKRSEQLMNEPKQYLATLRFGATTDTDDRESPEQPVGNPVAPSRDALEAALNQQVGLIQQRPPRISALKVGGMRACDRVRLGEQIDLAPRTVRIDRIELIDYAWPDATVRVDCGRGTYIRAIARDVGESLGVGAYLRELCRTRVGPYHIDDAIPLEQLTAERIAPLLTTRQ